MFAKLSFCQMFFEIWIHPRTVLREILEEDPKYFVWPLVIYFGFFPAFIPSYYFAFLHHPIYLILPIGMGWFLITCTFGFIFWFRLLDWKTIGWEGFCRKIKNCDGLGLSTLHSWISFVCFSWGSRLVEDCDGCYKWSEFNFENSGIVADFFNGSFFDLNDLDASFVDS